MKNPHYSKTGRFVEDLKSRQDSAKENYPYSKYVPKYIQKNWKSLFSKQLYGIGKDILYENNLLIQYGFTKQIPPASEQGSSQYSLTDKNGQIILWGFGMIFAKGSNGVFLWRHEFEPKLLDVNLLPSNVWEPGQLPQLTIPNTSNERHLMLQLLVSSIKWLERYENWVMDMCGESYRNRSLQSPSSSNMPSVRLDQKWSEINEKFEKILKKSDLGKISDDTEPEHPLPNQPKPANLPRHSVIPKNTCGACGENYPEDIKFCPSCNWEDLPC